MLFVLVFKIAYLRKILDHNLFWVVYFGPNSDETEKNLKFTVQRLPWPQEATDLIIMT